MGDRSKPTQLNSFEQLEVWQKAKDLAVTIYNTTQKFPIEEKFGLINQIRRASTSVSANIAEGFGRTSIKEKLNFYSIARGSLLEVKSFVYLASRLEFTDEKLRDLILFEITAVQKLLNGLFKSTRARDA